MPSLKHIHKYKRTKLGENYVVYACALPDCTHYLPGLRVVGKKSLCWVCDRVFVIWRDRNGVLARPHCKECTKSSKKNDNEKIDLPPISIPTIMP